MPGTRCAVYGCGNTYKTRQQEHEYFIFHRFPKAKDLVSQTMRKEWILRCKREDKFNPDTSYICSVHFTEKDYERDLQNELLGLPLRKILKKTAVPTLGLYSKKSTSEASSSSISSREERLAKRNAKEEVNKLLKVATLTAPINTFSDDTEDHNPKSFGSIQFEEHVPEPSTSSTPNFVPENYDYKALYNESVEKYEKLERQYALLKSRSNIKKLFWTREEIATAFTLRYYSKKSYLFLRNKLHYSLPGLSSLRRWASQLNLNQGILKDVLFLLKLAGESFSDFERTVVLQYDEVKVKKTEEYNIAQDEVLGPHNYMQVVMARGLFSNWKQPIYIGFDQKMTKSLLMDIITELHKINFNVVACVSDCGCK
ncbi:uncharacterized protein LOC130451987 [Diorhabda sublineata]|uniref:uncharacterized protein LOC130451987 n=1 Tax=Diorhabda sublineata TaxID=1163346 RepID=UPI0024E18D8A|nr:uncharacterized protein LOC130451987 [Diorhabda sublineata]